MSFCFRFCKEWASRSGIDIQELYKLLGLARGKHGLLGASVASPITLPTSWKSYHLWPCLSCSYRTLVLLCKDEFIWKPGRHKELETEEERDQREIFHPLAYPPHACNSQEWEQPKSAAGNSGSVSQVHGRNHGPSCLASQCTSGSEPYSHWDSKHSFWYGMWMSLNSLCHNAHFQNTGSKQTEFSVWKPWRVFDTEVNTLLGKNAFHITELGFGSPLFRLQLPVNVYPRS